MNTDLPYRRAAPLWGGAVMRNVSGYGEGLCQNLSG